MKKILYIISLILLIVPFKVKAETYAIEDGQIWQYHSSTPVKNITSGISELAGANYYYSLASIPNSDFFSFIFPFFDDKSYTINGSIFIETNQNISFIEYPLSLNGIVCEITPVYELSNSDMTKRIFSYSCPEVTMKREKNVFNFQSNSNVVNNIFGFSYNITYSSSISGAINNQTEEITKGQQETNQQLGDLNNNITNSDTTEANVSANDFFSGFESDDFGLSSIIIAPLNLIKSITSSTCTPIGFKAPFVNQQVTLPCMGSIYKEHFGTFLTIYQTITFGMVAYWVSVKIFFMVKGFKDPDSDRIEVLDL